ncbi:MAG: hypothetical protein JOZ72_15680 [Alphaproteobacteria bacterium]|nr:hypothetical protein [Alphaproteobacteria bacterium]
MSPPADIEQERIERLIQMAERLASALETDIAALKAGNPRGLRTLEPEMLKLSALYSREAAGLNAAAAKAAPADLRKRLSEATARFRDLLAAQTRLLTRLRGASEGMIRAVAEEIERQGAPLRTYGGGQSQRASGAMLYNSVV